MNAEKPLRRKPTNVSLDADLVSEAKELGINLSRACESGLSAEVREARKRQWVEENWQAIQSSNEYVAKNGLPLARYRRF